MMEACAGRVGVFGVPPMKDVGVADRPRVRTLAKHLRASPSGPVLTHDVLVRVVCFPLLGE